MPIDNARIKSQIISLLSANERSGGALQYSENLGDEGYLSEEIDTAIQYAKYEVGEAICEADGHSDGGLFTVDTAAEHGAELPEHTGTHGVPVITPYNGADIILTGTRKSFEEVESYRRNPNPFGLGSIYGDVPHDEENDGEPSRLAGFYAVVNNRFYFTGFSADIPLKNVTAENLDTLPAKYEPKIVNIALGKLAKDGTISEKYAHYGQMGMSNLNQIRSGKESEPNIKPTVGKRDVGTK